MAFMCPVVWFVVFVVFVKYDVGGESSVARVGKDKLTSASQTD